MTLLSKFFDWLSNLRPRQLFLLAAASAIIIFCIMYMGLKTFSSRQVVMPMGEDGAPVQQQQVKMINVVVAARNIEPKSMILGSMLTTKDIPESQVPSDAVTDVADIANKPAKNRIMKDAIITQQDVYRTIEQLYR